MAAEIKAIVFKTARLEATRHFFENVLQFSIKERSAHHFVIHSKGIRIVFVKSARGFETELFLNGGPGKEKEDLPAGFESFKDPNGINIIKFYRKSI